MSLIYWHDNFITWREKIEEVAWCNSMAGVIVRKWFEVISLFLTRKRHSIFYVAGRKGWRLHWPHQLHDWQSHRVQEETVSSKLYSVQCLLHLIQITFISHPPSVVWIKRNNICCGTVMAWKVLPHIVTRCINSWNYKHDQWSKHS